MVTLRWNFDSQEHLDRILPQVFTNMRAALGFIAEKHDAALASKHRAVPAIGGLIPVKSKGQPLSRGSGRLLESSGQDISPGPGARASAPIEKLRMVRYIGRGINYARIHEDGGEIGPVHRKVMTIPTRFVQTQAGDTRARAIHFPGYWRKTKRGALYFFHRDTGVPLFKGVGPGLDQETVKIPARLGFVDLFKAQRKGQERILQHAVGRGLRGLPLAAGGA